MWLLGCCCALDDFCFQGVIRVVSGRLEDEVLDFHSELWSKRAHDIFETSVLCCNTASGELRFDLGKPNFRVHGPKQLAINAHSGDGWDVSGIGSSRFVGGHPKLFETFGNCVEVTNIELWRLALASIYFE